MSDIIQFPNLEQAYLRQAQKALSEHRFDEGETLLLNSLDIAYSDEAFMELACVYILRHKTDSLRQLWDSHYRAYKYRITSEFLINLYAQSIPVLYVPQEALLQLYRLKEHALSSGWATDDITRIISQLDTNEQFIQDIKTAIQQDEIQAFIEEILQSKRFDSLLQLLKHLYNEPVDVFKPFYLELMKHNHIPHYIRSDVLHHLIYQGEKGVVDYYWFGNNKKLTLEELRPYNEQPLFIETVKAISNYCHKNDPQLLDILSIHWTMQAMVLYPFIDNVFTHPEEWLDCMVNINPEHKIPLHIKVYIDCMLDEVQQLFNQENPLV